MAKNLVGKTVTIKAGAKVSRAGRTSTRAIETKVRVRAQEATKGGKVRIYWKSNGLAASTLI